MVIEEAQKEHKGPKCQVMPLDVSNLASNFHHSLDDQENPISSFNQDDDIEWFNMLLGLFVHGDNFAKVDTSWFDTLSEEDIPQNQRSSVMLWIMKIMLVYMVHRAQIDGSY